MSDRKVFTIGDTHFGHKKVVEFRPYATVEEHDRDLIARWNAVVRPTDTVWHVGDVYFGGKDNHTILAELNGYKKLVMGNHDAYPIEFYLKYFVKILGAAEVRHCILTHVPVNENQFHRYKKNIHGHLHANKLQDPRFVCVSAEHTNYAPVELKTLVN